MTAFDSERDAETKLMDRVIELARPGLEAISNKVPAPQGAPDWRGLLVIDKWTDNDEDTNARRIYLLSEGEFLEQTREFDYDNIPFTTVCYRKRSTRHVIDRFDAVDIIDVLHHEFVKQAGKRVRSTDAAMDKAKKMNAILTLLAAPVSNPDVPF